jgi:predicted house-cleaning noncanonical NTP pyrophosphatase (MazG superfamily)
MFYNKLVRDKIPKIIERQGKKAIYRRLNDAEMKEALKAKLVEETQELVNAETKEQIIEEMADVLAVLNAMRKKYGINYSDVETMREEKAIDKGAFFEGIYLEEVQE